MTNQDALQPRIRDILGRAERGGAPDAIIQRAAIELAVAAERVRVAEARCDDASAAYAEIANAPSRGFASDEAAAARRLSATASSLVAAEEVFATTAATCEALLCSAFDC